MKLTGAQRQARYRARHPDAVRAAREAVDPKIKAAYTAQYRLRHPDRVIASAEKGRDKKLAQAKMRRLENPEKAKKRCVEYYEKNKDAVRAANKKWRENNVDKCKELKRTWIANNGDYYRARSSEYGAVNRLLVKQATPAWANKFFIREIYHLASLRTKYLCVKHHVDHIVPINSKFVCGLHVEQNLRVIPAILNISKGNRVWPDMHQGA